MKNILLIFSFFVINLQALTNVLVTETSPYLLQHATNPVAWQPYSQKTLDLAKKLNKPIFLSIGYATCHWCHVMEEESFANTQVATLLNKYFVSIKVDREEMPNIDAYYQTVYKKVFHRLGGWPLHVFMTPEGEVFYITNYIPPKNIGDTQGFISLLPYLSKVYHSPDMLHFQLTLLKRKQKEKKTKSDLTLENVQNSLLEHFDDFFMGFGDEKKFPEAAKLQLLFDVALLQKNKAMQQLFYKTLDAMALGGLYDHVEGGFFRYATDTMWEIPHFEKMLYTQAQMIRLYTNAYVRTQKQLYLRVVKETIAMLEQKLLTEDKLFYSALDAGSLHKEGEYYTFSLEEIKHALDDNPNKKRLQHAMALDKYGNFHGREHIHFITKKIPKAYDGLQKKLLHLRTRRRAPFVDTKYNTAWNAMMIGALFDAGIVNKHYAVLAQKSLDSLVEKVFYHGVLYHQYIGNGLRKQEGFLEDYAYVIDALLRAYEYDFDKKKLAFAHYLLIKAKELFYRKGRWYFTKEHKIYADTYDKYYTSSVALMIQNMLRYAALNNDFSMEKTAKRSLQYYNYSAHLELKSPALVEAMFMKRFGLLLLKGDGETLQKAKKFVKMQNYPFILMKKTAYQSYELCTMRRCFLQTTNLQEVQNFIENKKHLK